MRINRDCRRPLRLQRALGRALESVNKYLQLSLCKTYTEMKKKTFDAPRGIPFRFLSSVPSSKIFTMAGASEAYVVVHIVRRGSPQPTATFGGRIVKCAPTKIVINAALAYVRRMPKRPSTGRSIYYRCVL
ncbi:hypothetical protein EVAR_57658_1 [Eumeta japonica]|uniref:Uncharacterized protein n=1 Tax=Eumeta variegata TaxID=151549 RepID=A0A4C1Z024_EUMVA|nr:hypothetical protein EVAR_57658_1 [Eumeta japonica]